MRRNNKPFPLPSIASVTTTAPALTQGGDRSKRIAKNIEARIVNNGNNNNHGHNGKRNERESNSNPNSVKKHQSEKHKSSNSKNNSKKKSNNSSNTNNSKKKEKADQNKEQLHSDNKRNSVSSSDGNPEITSNNGTHTTTATATTASNNTNSNALRIQSDEALKNRINLSVLQKRDSHIAAIECCFDHVVLYKFNTKKAEWTKQDVEGSMFVVRRTSLPTYRFVIMNRKNTHNFVQDIHRHLELELQLPFVYYKSTKYSGPSHSTSTASSYSNVADNASRGRNRGCNASVHGIWFYNTVQSIQFNDLVQSLVKELTTGEPHKPMVALKDFDDDGQENTAVNEEQGQGNAASYSAMDGREAGKQLLQLLQARPSATESQPPPLLPHHHHQQQQPLQTTPTAASSGQFSQFLAKHDINLRIENNSPPQDQSQPTTTSRTVGPHHAPVNVIGMLPNPQVILGYMGDKLKDVHRPTDRIESKEKFRRALIDMLQSESDTRLLDTLYEHFLSRQSL